MVEHYTKLCLYAIIYINCVDINYSEHQKEGDINEQKYNNRNRKINIKTMKYDRYKRHGRRSKQYKCYKVVSRSTFSIYR